MKRTVHKDKTIPLVDCKGGRQKLVNLGEGDRGQNQSANYAMTFA